MKEIFKDVLGYEGMYQVSNLGRIKSLKYGREIILKATLDSDSYYRVNLSKEGKQKTKRVHQLVVVAFLNHVPNGNDLVVDHIDFNKTNNNLSNLRIVTHRENSNRKHLKSTSQYTGVYWHKERNRWKVRIGINGKNKCLGSFINELDASNTYETVLKKLK